MDVKDLCLMGLYDSADVDMLQETKKITFSQHQCFFLVSYVRIIRITHEQQHFHH